MNTDDVAHASERVWIVSANEGILQRPFLTARWRALLMLNYEIDPAVLEPLVPEGVQLDRWQGRTFISLVGFLFLNTRVRGIPIPFHRNFEEVNLRFYVGREAPEGWRRGVVFIREIVPRRAIAALARWVYGENYVSHPMRSAVALPENGAEGAVKYAWRAGQGECGFRASVSGLPQPIATGSEEEFITEHYWGYSTGRDGRTLEYQVEHPHWNVWTARRPEVWGDLAAFYGPAFGEVLNRPPTSAFVADGSAVCISPGTGIAWNVSGN